MQFEPVFYPKTKKKCSMQLYFYLTRFKTKWHYDVLATLKDRLFKIDHTK